ncbi:MAG: hypothetical protein R3B09_03880 [Nannocystaceae bacterium]
MPVSPARIVTPFLGLACALGLAACTQQEPKAAPAQAPAPAPAPSSVVIPGPTPAHGEDSTLPKGHPPIAGGPAGAASAPKNPREVTPSGTVRQETLGGLTMELPTEWTAQPPRSSMRLAEFIVPGPGGDVELAVYRFPGGAGGTEANISRWKGQFTPPEGKTIEDVTQVDVQERAPLKITRVDITGTNVAEAMPGAGDRRNEPDSRMLAAIIEGAGDPFFLKAAGPSATLDLWAPAFTKVLEGVKTAL